jgi:hypothetical protein
MVQNSKGSDGTDFLHHVMETNIFLAIGLAGGVNNLVS